MGVLHKILRLLFNIAILTFPIGVLVIYAIILNHGIKLVIAHRGTSEKGNYKFYEGIFIIFVDHIMIIMVAFLYIGSLLSWQPSRGITHDKHT